MVAWCRTAWRDFVDMSGAVIAAWRVMAVPLVAGGLITAYDRATGIPVDAAVLEVPLLIAFVLAFFIAWQKRQRILETALRDLDKAREDSKVPALYGYFKAIAKGGVTGMGRPFFFAYVEIRNDGFRSTVKDFCPAVVLNGREYLGRLLKTAKTVTLTSSTGEKDKFREKDAIYNITKTPIEPGEHRAGHLHFYFPQKRGDFDKHLIKIYFRDYRNTTFVTEPIEAQGTTPANAMPNLAGLFSIQQYKADDGDAADKGDDKHG